MLVKVNVKVCFKVFIYVIVIHLFYVSIYNDTDNAVVKRNKPQEVS